MKNAKTADLCTAGLAASVVIFLLTGATLIRGGYARDAGIYLSGALDALVWITLGACLVSFAVFCLLGKFAPVRGKAAACALLAVLIVGGLAANIAWRTACSRQEKASPEVICQEGNLPSYEEMYGRGRKSA